MKAFTICRGVAAVMMHDNIDTDQIIRIERIAQLRRGEFAPWVFEGRRYLPDGSEDSAFVLNAEPFRHAAILIAGDNFGCGSSREMAVWALEEFGIRCIIAPSFGDIFFSNCLQNGLLPVVLERGDIQRLAAAASSGAVLSVDLRSRTVGTDQAGEIHFDLLDAQREALLLGQDDIAQTLTLVSQIDDFQQEDRLARPWVYMAAVF
ncbi:3-isopropylmalate dehydratase small subunit [Pollutimonas subterranea]|uniref:3-isopropylmalate dehydratase n=1 Tax=Pollutimonas subterranea TaxID=2045210 RepID=A0A2N4U8K1_9BURK|nr:3-isopropylmalate dehydratase small subunit [Pollutimonas subterranea]PLC51340.1 3-isopropylmalate dehydratase small subunit [Pollutimonas subterranea]